MRIAKPIFVLAILSPLVALCCLGRASDGTVKEPDNFFRQYVGLTDDQISAIHKGKAIARIVESPRPGEVFVFGAVHVDATPESYLKFAADLDRLRKLPDYLAIRKFSDPPTLADLDGFTLEDEDVKQLRDCRPGKCEVQLPADVMEEFQKSIDWSAPDVDDRVNHTAQQLALRALQAYISAGNDALGTYEDKQHPAEVSKAFEDLMDRSKALPVYLPELDRYLLDYPKATLPDAQSQIYWEKVNFGLKPTLRIVQAIVYRGSSPTEPAYAVAVKQLYASHYFQAALDMTVCVRDQAPEDAQSRGATGKPGFFLITMKGSQQAGLTGFKGGIVRKVAVDRTRSSLERGLAAIKMQLESQGQAQ